MYKKQNEFPGSCGIENARLTPADHLVNAAPLSRLNLFQYLPFWEGENLFEPPPPPPHHTHKHTHLCVKHIEQCCASHWKRALQKLTIIIINCGGCSVGSGCCGWRRGSWWRGRRRCQGISQVSGFYYWRSLVSSSSVAVVAFPSWALRGSPSVCGGIVHR